MNKSNQIDMLNGPLMGKLVRFAIPFAASSILQQLREQPGIGCGWS